MNVIWMLFLCAGIGVALIIIANLYGSFEGKEISMEWLKTLRGWFQLARTKLKPRLSKLWVELKNKIKQASKWLWQHKTEKKVWVTTLIAVVTGLMVAGVISIRRFWSASTAIITNPTDLHWGWLLETIAGVMIILIEVMVIALTWQGTFKRKTVGKVHMWVLGIGSLVWAAFYWFVKTIGSDPWGKIKTWGENSWEFISEWVINNPLWVALVGAVIFLIVYKAIRRYRSHHHPTPPTQSASSHGGSHSHGGHGGGIPWGWIILTIMVLGGISINFQSKEIVENRRRSQWAASDSNGRQALVTHGFVTALPDREVPIYIPEGMYVTTDPAYTNQNVWVRYDGEDRFMDRKGRTNAGIVTHNNLRSRHLFLQSAEATPVVVEWSLRPLPNR